MTASRSLAFIGIKGGVGTSLSVALPNLTARHNLNALEIARRFDDPAWRTKAIEALARALASVPGSGGRVALPAFLGIREHAAVLEAVRRGLPAAPFEMPLVPPSVPGMRLFNALRAALIRAGGRVQIGEMVERVESTGRTVTAVASAAAVRVRTPISSIRATTSSRRRRTNG